MIPKLDWSAFYKATQMLGDVEVSVPEKLIDGYDKDTDFLKKVHHALLEVIFQLASIPIRIKIMALEKIQFFF